MFFAVLDWLGKSGLLYLYLYIMNKKIIAIVIIFFHSFFSLGQDTRLPYQMKIVPLPMLQGMVVELCRVPDTSVMPLTGTGCFIFHNDNLYLVTAAHVARYMDSKSFIFGRGDSGHTVKVLIQDIDSTNKIKWVHHSLADISILKVNARGEMRNSIMTIAFNSNMFERRLVVPDPGVELTLLGFPLGLGINASNGKSSTYFSAFSKRTYASSGLFSHPRGDNNEMSSFFSLQDPITQGYSGGPVFDISIYSALDGVATGNGLKCYGFAHGTLSDNTGGKIGVVTPSYFLFDLIY